MEDVTILGLEWSGKIFILLWQFAVPRVIKKWDFQKIVLRADVQCRNDTVFLIVYFFKCCWLPDLSLFVFQLSLCEALVQFDKMVAHGDTGSGYECQPLLGMFSSSSLHIPHFVLVLFTKILQFSLIWCFQLCKLYARSKIWALVSLVCVHLGISHLNETPILPRVARCDLCHWDTFCRDM